MRHQQFSSVWDAIEDTPEEAENMKLRSGLMMALQKYLTRTEVSQAQAAKLGEFKKTTPKSHRVSTHHYKRHLCFIGFS